MLPFLAFRAPYTLSNQSGPDDQRSSHIESMEKPLQVGEHGGSLAATAVPPKTPCITLLEEGDCIALVLC